MMVKNAENRSQMEFVSLEEMVPQNHLLRKIDAAIDFNKLYEFVEKLYCEDNGRPSIDPVVLFKIVLIQHIYGISSLRRTLEEVSMNLAYRWFIGYPLNEAVPHFSIVSYNFKHRFNHATVEYVFRWVLKAAAEEGYLDTEAIFVDGTHIKASANLKKQAKKAVPKEAKRYARELFEEVNKDREEHGKKPFSDDSDKKPPKEKETVVSTTDLESGVFHKGEHKKCFAYEAHTACDKHNFILGVHITPGNVHDSVAFDPLYDELCEYYPEHQTVVADSAYKTPWICKRIFESGRTLATCYTRPKTKKNGHPWWTYVYDEYFDDVICPEYRALHYTTTNRDGYREYKSRTYFCKNCPTRAQCTENAKCEKTVLRHVWQDFVEMAEHVRHMTVYRELYRLRKEKIERVFADAKEKHGMRYTQYRGLAQVTNWVKLKFAAMNLKKLATWKWNDSHPGPDGGKRRRLSDVYSRFLQFFCFQLKSPLWSVYQNGLFLQPETPIGVILYILSSFLSSKRSLRGGNGLPLPLNLVVRRVLSYVPTVEWQTCPRTRSAACATHPDSPARFAGQDAVGPWDGSRCPAAFAHRVYPFRSNIFPGKDSSGSLCDPPNTPNTHRWHCGTAPSLEALSHWGNGKHLSPHYKKRHPV